MRFATEPQGSSEERSSSYLNPPDMVNHLLLIWPVDYEHDTYTKYPRQDGQPSDAVYCDVVDLSVNGPDGQPGYLMRGCKWTQGRLIRDTKKLVGSPDPLLKLMGKDGDAYQLFEQSTNPAAVSVAEAWATRNPGFRPGSDQPPKFAPQQQGPIRSTAPYPQQYPVPPAQVQQPQFQQPLVVPQFPTQPESQQPLVVPQFPTQPESPMDRLRRQTAHPYFQPQDLPQPPQDENPPY